MPHTHKQLTAGWLVALFCTIPNMSAQGLCSAAGNHPSSEARGAPRQQLSVHGEDEDVRDAG